MSASTVGRVGVIGTGVVGASWAALFLAAGLEVTASDPAPDAEERLRRDIDDHWTALQRISLGASAARDRLRLTPDVSEAVSTADFIQESGPERIEIKRALFAELDEAAPRGSVIASSSSGLGPTDIQRDCTNEPERVLVGHPFNPAHLIPLVEVVSGHATSDAATQAAIEFYR
jgi:carnitine 3-dehydrogenase